jgi:hypothetical protein
MFLQLFKGRGVRGFARKIHTQMCLASLFRQQHRKVVNEWNDDDDEQRQIFHEEEINRGHAAVPSDMGTSSGLVHCTHENKPDTYMIHYEGGVGIISR